MSEPATEFVVRRILIALDASASSLAALRAAVTLAAELGADLEGLFVEDANLMRIATLPVARRVLFPSAAEEPLDSSSMELELKVLARRAQRSLAALAEHSGIRWTFRVVRGNVPLEILAAASESDLLTVGCFGWSLARRMQMGSTAQSAAINAPKALLLVKQPLAIYRPVLVLFDSSPLAEQALKAAARFAGAFQSPLTIFILAEAPENDKALMQKAARLLETAEVSGSFRTVFAAGTLQLADAIESEGGGLLVLCRQYSRVPENEIQELVRRVENPVLLVR
jgi:nucleotide-binding universal stress UspA family protein